MRRKGEALCRRRRHVSLRLGHAAALTTIQVVIHYRVAASLPLNGERKKAAGGRFLFFVIEIQRLAYIFRENLFTEGHNEKDSGYFTCDIHDFPRSRGGNGDGRGR